MMAAILSKNMPGWKLQLYHSLGLEHLPKHIEILMRRREIESYGRSVLVRGDAWRRTRAGQRVGLRQQNQQDHARTNPLAYARNPYITP